MDPEISHSKVYFWQLILNRSLSHNDNEKNYGFLSKTLTTWLFTFMNSFELFSERFFFNTSFGRKLHYTTKYYIYYICEIRYLNSPRLKQDNPDIEQKETGKSFYDLAMDMDVLILMSLFMN